MFFLYSTFCSYKKILKNISSDIKIPFIDNKLKFLGASTADIIMTFIISYFISIVMNLNFYYVFLVLFVFGLILQVYLCRRDIINFGDKQIKKIFPNIKFSMNDVKII